MKVLKLLLVLLAVLGAVGFIYMGVYPIGADVPHTKPAEARRTLAVTLAIEEAADTGGAVRLDDGQRDVSWHASTSR